MCAQPTFMREHPLRESLDDEDLKRIDQVMQEKAEPEFATADEIEAVYDIMYDYIAANTQTHLGSSTLQ
jgi:hypothetical protein